MHAVREPVLGGTVYFIYGNPLAMEIFFCFLLCCAVLLLLLVQENLGCHVRLMLKFLALLGSLLTSNKSLKLHGSFYI